MNQNMNQKVTHGGLINNSNSNIDLNVNYDSQNNFVLGNVSNNISNNYDSPDRSFSFQSLPIGHAGGDIQVASGLSQASSCMATAFHIPVCHSISLNSQVPTIDV